MENVPQLHKLITHHGLAHVLKDFVEVHVTLFVENVRIIVVVMVFALVMNVLVTSDLLVLTVLMLTQFIHAQITAQEEDIANKPTQPMLLSNASVKVVSQDLIVQKYQFSVLEIVQVKVSANVMGLAPAKTALLELLANK